MTIFYFTQSMYYIYILKCSDSTLYTGYTNDLEKRVKAHNEGNRGAKYTKGRRPVELVYFEKFEDESTAKKREWEIKKLKKKEKIYLIENPNRRTCHPELVSGSLMIEPGSSDRVRG